MIRSLTIGLPLGSASPSQLNGALERFNAVANKKLADGGYDCRTVRLTLPPAGSDFEMEGALAARVSLAQELAERNGVRWFCLPLDYVGDADHSIRSADAVPLLSRYPNMFLNYILAADGEIATGSSIDVGRDILRIAKLSNNGFDNFRVGTSFNLAPNNPFFPFSHHDGSELAFSFALETTDLALAIAAQGSGGMGAKADRFSAVLAAELERIDELASEIEAATGVAYRGSDASLAPLPNGKTSVAAVVEELLLNPVGGHGTVLATALLTDSIRKAFESSGARSAGFNGVMYSVLEDEQLSAAVGRRHVSLDGLLSFASVCGCGLDMIPIPGHSFSEEIAAVILDVAAMSSALAKPLRAAPAADSRRIGE